jgi:hypothetical protein
MAKTAHISGCVSRHYRPIIHYGKYVHRTKNPVVSETNGFGAANKFFYKFVTKIYIDKQQLNGY